MHANSDGLCDECADWYDDEGTRCGWPCETALVVFSGEEIEEALRLAAVSSPRTLTPEQEAMSKTIAAIYAPVIEQALRSETLFRQQ